jgi:hypothetical protein
VSALGAADRSRARMLGVVSSRRPQIGSSGDCSSAADSLISRFGDIGISPKHPYNVRVRIKAMADFSLGAIGKSWSQHRANSMSSTRGPTSDGRTRADIEAHLTESNACRRVAEK